MPKLQANKRVKSKPLTLGEIVDEMGKIKAKQADLEKQYEKYRQKLVKANRYEVSGILFRALIHTDPKTTTDWKGVVQSLEQTPALKRKIRSARSTKDVTTVEIKAR